MGQVGIVCSEASKDASQQASKIEVNGRRRMKSQAYSSSISIEQAPSGSLAIVRGIAVHEWILWNSVVAVVSVLLERLPAYAGFSEQFER